MFWWVGVGGLSPQESQSYPPKYGATTAKLMQTEPHDLDFFDAGWCIDTLRDDPTCEQYCHNGLNIWADASLGSIWKFVCR